MIDVVLYRTDGKLLAFTVEGHAGYADRGSDIVCAAVSAITQTTILGLEEILDLTANIEIKEGKLSLILNERDPEKSMQAELLLETMVLGLYGIKTEHEEHLSIREEEVDPGEEY